MYIRNFSSSCFLRNVFGTEPFLEYCQQRGISLPQSVSAIMQEGDLRRWVAALSELSSEQQATVELELTTVSDMANHGSIAQLLRGIRSQDLPADSIPGDTALALWFFLRHPTIFHEVFLHQGTQNPEAWWNAQATPNVVLDNLPDRAAALAERLREVFQVREGTGRFCAVDARRINGAYCFVVRVADRLRFLEVFTESGEYVAQAVLPALPVIFVYYPLDGTILLQTRLTDRDSILELFQWFARSVLEAELPEACMEYVFDLEPLKKRFDPLRDADDMQMVRVKTLHFRYPERYGRRQVKLETLLSDEQFAISQLIEAHMDEGTAHSQVEVSHAEIQIKLTVNGGIKSYVIRLWPNRCSLSQSALDERFRACLKSWGLYHLHDRRN